MSDREFFENLRNSREGKRWDFQEEYCGRVIVRELGFRFHSGGDTPQADRRGSHFPGGGL